MRPDKRVEPLAQPVWCDRTADIDMRAHRQRVNSGISAPGREEGRAFAGHPLDGVLKRLLDRGAMILPLPTHERAAVIFDRQPPPGHGRVVPLGIGKPLNNSPGVMWARPAR